MIVESALVDKLSIILTFSSLLMLEYKVESSLERSSLFVIPLDKLENTCVLYSSYVLVSKPTEDELYFELIELVSKLETSFKLDTFSSSG